MLKISIKTKILLIMLVVAFIPGVIGVSSTYFKGSQVFQKAIGDKFIEIARQASLTVDSLIRKEISESLFLAANPDVEEFVSDRESIKNRLEQLKQYLAIEHGKAGHSNISIYNLEGETLYSLRPAKAAPFIDPESLLMLGNGERKVVVGEVYTDSSNKLTLPIYAPISVDGGKLQAILAVSLDLFEFFNDGLGDMAMIDTGHINVVASDGTVLYDPLVYEGAEPFPDSIMNVVRNEKASWFTDVDEHGIRSVISFSPLTFFHDGSVIKAGKNRYFAILTQEEEELFVKPVRDVLLSAAIPGFFFASILIFAVYIALRKIVRPISVLKDGVVLIGKGDLDYRIKIKTGDEIEELAVEFNQMASELKELYTGLGQKVKERTLELEASNRELEEASRLKSEFLANMSHELRTPLNSIIGFSEVLVDQVYGETNEKQTRYLTNIHKSGKHLLELINGILDLSKIEAGKMDFVLEDFPFSNLVEEVKTVLTPLAKKQGIRLGISVADDVGLVSADRLKLKQIMYNLVGNAIKFTPSGGNVRLDAVREGDLLKVSVTDTGVGINENDLDVIFEAFRQVDGSHSRNFEGTGLGLALTKSFVEMHGGNLSVKSKVAEGSVFTFTIPTIKIVEKEHRAVPAEETCPAPVYKKGGLENCVLIVEDNRSASELLAMYLTEGGYKVAQAYNGEDAVIMAKELNPCAITLDVMLPKMDGWEVLRELKKDESTREIPVVIVSMVDDRNIGYALGAMETFTKPVSKKELLAVLGRHSFTTRAKSGKVKIMVVDDEPKVLELLSAILEPEGFDVITAGGGREALDLAAKVAPDLMILDLMMPEVSGFDVVHEMRKNPETKGVPIVIFTAKEVTKKDKERLNGDIEKIVKKAGFSKDDLLGEIARARK